MKFKIAAIVSLAGLVVLKNITPTLTTASISLALAAILAVTLLPLVREALEEVIG